MTKPHLICRVSRRLLRLASKFAPTQLHEWNSAMLAELESIEQPLQALQWTFGCVMVTAKESVVQGFAGAWHSAAEVWNFGKAEEVPMRHAKIATVVALVIALGFLLSASFRQAMGVAATTLFSRRGSFYMGDKSPVLDQLRLNAEQKGDAKMLAYVALHEQRPEIALEAANQAVAIDPQWTWIYYRVAYKKGFDDPASMSRLQQWAPQNAAVYLLEADRIASKSKDYYRPTVGNEPWIEMATRAFDAPKYDTYVREHFNLEREIDSQRGIAPLQIFSKLRPYWIYGLGPAQRYAGFILGASGRPREEVIRDAKRAATFGERLTGGSTEMERMAGAHIALDAYEKLESLSSPEEREFLGVRVEYLRSFQRASRRDFFSPILMQVLIPNATIVQGCLLLILAAVLTLAGSIVALLFRHRKGVNTLLWVASGILLVACTVGYVAYLPFVQLSEQLTNSQTSMESALFLSRALDSFSSTPLLQLSDARWLPIYAWTSLIVLLSLGLMWIMTRNLHQMLRRHFAASAA